MVEFSAEESSPHAKNGFKNVANFNLAKIFAKFDFAKIFANLNFAKMLQILS